MGSYFSLLQSAIIELDPTSNYHHKLQHHHHNPFLARATLGPDRNGSELLKKCSPTGNARQQPVVAARMQRSQQQQQQLDAATSRRVCSTRAPAAATSDGAAADESASALTERSKREHQLQQQQRQQLAASKRSLTIEAERPHEQKNKDNEQDTNNNNNHTNQTQRQHLQQEQQASYNNNTCNNIKKIKNKNGKSKSQQVDSSGVGTGTKLARNNSNHHQQAASMSRAGAKQQRQQQPARKTATTIILSSKLHQQQQQQVDINHQEQRQQNKLLRGPSGAHGKHAVAIANSSFNHQATKQVLMSNQEKFGINETRHQQQRHSSSTATKMKQSEQRRGSQVSGIELESHSNSKQCGGSRRKQPRAGQYHLHHYHSNFNQLSDDQQHQSVSNGGKQQNNAGGRRQQQQQQQQQHQSGNNIQRTTNQAPRYQSNHRNNHKQQQQHQHQSKSTNHRQARDQRSLSTSSSLTSHSSSSSSSPCSSSLSSPPSPTCSLMHIFQQHSVSAADGLQQHPQLPMTMTMTASAPSTRLASTNREGQKLLAALRAEQAIHSSASSVISLATTDDSLDSGAHLTQSSNSSSSGSYTQSSGLMSLAHSASQQLDSYSQQQQQQQVWSYRQPSGDQPQLTGSSNYESQQQQKVSVDQIQQHQLVDSRDRNYPKPPPRPWQQVAGLKASARERALRRQQLDDGLSPMKLQPEFTAISYNVLSARLVNSKYFPVSPVYSLGWFYRRELIMRQLLEFDADLIALQELELEHYEQYFKIELERRANYQSIFAQKSRAKTMDSEGRKHVDGCAIFFKKNKFKLVQQHVMEFSQIAMANSAGSEAMINRVMTKDNIGIACILEFIDDEPQQQQLVATTSGDSGGDRAPPIRLLVCNTHLFWNPEHSDVKLIQTIMLMNELKSIAKMHNKQLLDESQVCELQQQQHEELLYNDDHHHRQSSLLESDELLPLVLLGDFNSKPDSGVTNYLTDGNIDSLHKDFKQFKYNRCSKALAPIKAKSLQEQNELYYDYTARRQSSPAAANWATSSTSSSTSSSSSSYSTASLSRSSSISPASSVNPLLIPSGLTNATQHRQEHQVSSENRRLSTVVDHDDSTQDTSYNNKHSSPSSSSNLVLNYTHPFQLSSAYEENTMPYTNYTPDFKEVIDYIFYSHNSIQLIGLLGPISDRWLRNNKILGLPQPHLPSDHLPLLVKFKLNDLRSDTSHCYNNRNKVTTPIDPTIANIAGGHLCCDLTPSPEPVQTHLHHQQQQHRQHARVYAPKRYNNNNQTLCSQQINHKQKKSHIDTSRLKHEQNRF